MSLRVLISSSLSLVSDFLVHRIRISDILPCDKKTYLTHAILSRLSREGYIPWL